ncbi:unnamed protein product [Amoebophrya sp. A25]|nr:unnamed protein product [Amoebophrya sp. A25]|eukprot:GSA25T00002453001.1
MVVQTEAVGLGLPPLPPSANLTPRSGVPRRPAGSTATRPQRRPSLMISPFRRRNTVPSIDIKPKDKIIINTSEQGTPRRRRSSRFFCCIAPDAKQIAAELENTGEENVSPAAQKRLCVESSDSEIGMKPRSSPTSKKKTGIIASEEIYVNELKVAAFFGRTATKNATAESTKNHLGKTLLGNAPVMWGKDRPSLSSSEDEATSIDARKLATSTKLSASSTTAYSGSGTEDEEVGAASSSSTETDQEKEDVVQKTKEAKTVVLDEVNEEDVLLKMRRAPLIQVDGFRKNSTVMQQSFSFRAAAHSIRSPAARGVKKSTCPTFPPSRSQNIRTLPAAPVRTTRKNTTSTFLTILGYTLVGISLVSVSFVLGVFLGTGCSVQLTQELLGVLFVLTVDVLNTASSSLAEAGIKINETLDYFATASLSIKVHSPNSLENGGTTGGETTRVMLRFSDLSSDLRQQRSSTVFAFLQKWGEAAYMHLEEHYWRSSGYLESVAEYGFLLTWQQLTSGWYAWRILGVLALQFMSSAFQGACSLFCVGWAIPSFEYWTLSKPAREALKAALGTVDTWVTFAIAPFASMSSFICIGYEKVVDLVLEYGVEAPFRFLVSDEHIMVHTALGVVLLTWVLHLVYFRIFETHHTQVQVHARGRTTYAAPSC